MDVVKIGQLIKENLANKKVVKAIIADFYGENKKIKNLMSLSLDTGIVDKIVFVNYLTKQEIYRFANILHSEYGVGIEDAILIVHEWAGVFDIDYEDDELFLTAKEFMNADIGDIINWKEIKDDVFNIISYVYILADDEKRSRIIENSEQLWDENNVKDIIVNNIKKFEEQDFLHNVIDSVFSCIYVTAESAIKKHKPEVINIKCFANLKIILLQIVAIVYRDKKVYQSLYLIIITALLHVNKCKLEKAGFIDQSFDNNVVSFPQFDEVISHSSDCEEESYCDSDVQEINDKCKILFEIIKKGVFNGTIENICSNTSSLLEDYVSKNLKISVEHI